MRTYQLAARLWLTAAGLSLALPASARAGTWLPLHLAVAGAVATAISGAMQTFASALTSTPTAPVGVVGAQLTLVSVGPLLIAIGFPGGRTTLVAFGGAAFVAAMTLLGWSVLRAWRRGLNRRHGVPISMYLGAITCVVAGGVLGAILGWGGVDDPQLSLGLRSAHMALNVLGFVSVTIAATLVTLLPTVLRVQMPRWPGRSSAGCLLGGAAVLAAGLAIRSTPVGLLGAIAFAAGTIGVVALIVRVLRVPRAWPVPLPAKHLGAGVAWFVLGSGWLVVAVARGSFAGFREPFLVVFVCGWILQVLLGAWLYLLPMSRPGHPDERRRELAGVEVGGALQLLALNVGVALLVVRAAGWSTGALGAVGAGLALGGGGIALVKAWSFPVLGRLRAFGGRQRAVWGP
jgi:nitrite reductase (NO-forming)